MVSSYIKSAVAAVTLMAAGMMVTNGAASAADDKSAIESTLSSYNGALNAGDTAAVLPLYTDDGIFMPPYSQSAIGRDAIRKAYDDVFKELKFNVKFNIAEIVQMAPTWAYVRTNSAGTTAHHSTGRTTSEANQELFVFKKSDDGAWKIATASPPPTHRPSSNSIGDVTKSRVFQTDLARTHLFRLANHGGLAPILIHAEPSMQSMLCCEPHQGRIINDNGPTKCAPLDRWRMG